MLLCLYGPEAENFPRNDGDEDGAVQCLIKWKIEKVFIYYNDRCSSLVSDYLWMMDNKLGVVGSDACFKGKQAEILMNYSEKSRVMINKVTLMRFIFLTLIISPTKPLGVIEEDFSLQIRFFFLPIHIIAGITFRSKDIDGFLLKIGTLQLFYIFICLPQFVI